ncbi:ATP-binding protein [Argonema antarcticum]|uniref:ATP-binding protein n=1 Tax=Argonema antarcticum TaxID=2942763 RepID=UPI0020136845|nr:ATP-binding protein [Argonema antarcticum]MCL1470127.1 GAF domain-containing protein [Argonema antarcticum A004/B2]
MTPQQLTIPTSGCNQTSQEQKSSKQAALWQSQKKSRHLLANIPGLSYQFLLRKDGSLSFLFLSPTFHEFFEVESPEMEMDTESLISMIHPDDREDFFNSITEAAGMLQSWRWVGRFILPSKQIKWIQWDAQPSLQANGNIFWNGLLVDVTSHQNLNAEVERLSFLLGLTERLQSSSDLREIAEFALSYLVSATNCAFGDVKVINSIDETSQAVTLTNYISAEFVATYGETAVAEIETALQRGIPKGQGVLWQVVETGQPALIKDYANHPNAVSALRHPGIGQICIFPIPATDGTVIGVMTLESRNFQQIEDALKQDLLLAACRILGVRIERAKDRERLQRANAVLQSTSEQLREQTHQLEETLHELQQAQIQLIQSEKMSSLGQLVAGVAHEINNPVSFIHGNLTYADRYFQDLLSLLQLYQQHYPQPEPEIQSAIEEIDLDFLSTDLPKLMCSMKVGSERIRDIVWSLRNFSRIDQAKMKPVDIHEGINNTLMILNNRLKAQPNRREIKVIEEYGNLPLVECYPGQINQVFMNIIANAIDALEEIERQRSRESEEEANGSELPIPNYVSPTLRISTEIKGERIAIRIADNGCGIPESLVSRIFDPFFTTKPVGKGTGLGLSISHQIVTEQHGGLLKCISAVGQGTEFAIEIPLVQPK